MASVREGRAELEPGKEGQGPLKGRGYFPVPEVRGFRYNFQNFGAKSFQARGLDSQGLFRQGL